MKRIKHTQAVAGSNAPGKVDLTYTLGNNHSYIFLEDENWELDINDDDDADILLGLGVFEEVQ